MCTACLWSAGGGAAHDETKTIAAWRDGMVDMQVLINGPRPVIAAPPPPTDDIDLAA